MLRNGVARCSDSPWASPLHFVPKKEDGWRPCGDYCSLNATTVPYQYPVRHIADFVQQLVDRQVFSTIDLVKAYHQIPFHLDDIVKAAIITPFGLIEFPYMSFGLRNAAQTFQWLIDNVLVASTSEDKHEQHLRTSFQRFSEYGVLLNPAKCVFGARDVTSLVYTDSAGGTRPMERKVAAIKRFQQPVFIRDF